MITLNFYWNSVHVSWRSKCFWAKGEKSSGKTAKTWQLEPKQDYTLKMYKSTITRLSENADYLASGDIDSVNMRE